MYINKNQLVILVTGAAGFIGAAVCQRLIREGHKVIGFDNLNSYYSKNLKKARVSQIDEISNKYKIKWNFYERCLSDRIFLDIIFKKHSPTIVIHLAAQAGVRYSMQNPSAYFESNIIGFGNVLECCRNYGVNNLIYASSSSVYGGNKNIPFQENHIVDHPISLYAATKKSNELLAHAYSHLFKIPSTGLRFFTVYGPWGRPDMAPMIFVKSIISGKPINVYNYGKMKRDFTYIDDVVEGIYRCIFKPANSDKSFNRFKPNPAKSFAPHRIFNIGNSKPIELLKFIVLIEDKLKLKAIKNMMPIQPGDVEVTCADTSELKEWIEYKPVTNIEDGINKFVDWYRNFYSV